MKKYLLFFGLLTSSLLCAQDVEFKTYSNGLIYSEYAMNNLSNVVDSLNLKFRTCDFDKKFYGKAQTVGHFIELERGDIKQAVKDLKNQISLDVFLKKYPKASVRKNLLIVKFKYKNYKEKDVIDFSEIDLSNGSGRRFQFDENLKEYDKNLKKQMGY